MKNMNNMKDIQNKFNKKQTLILSSVVLASLFIFFISIIVFINKNSILTNKSSISTSTKTVDDSSVNASLSPDQVVKETSINIDTTLPNLDTSLFDENLLSEQNLDINFINTNTTSSIQTNPDVKSAIDSINSSYNDLNNLYDTTDIN